MVWLTALNILAYGSQSFLESKLVPIIVIGICFVVFTTRKMKTPFSLAACTLGILLLTQIEFLRNLWPLPSVLITLLTACILWRTQNKKWYGLIEFKIRPAMIAILLGLISFATVAAWVHFTTPSMEQIPFKIPNGTPLIQVTGMILIFAVLNSFAEEFIFRGLALTTMMPKSFWIANAMQSSGFMFLHYQGFPFGFSGAVLAGAFAFMMGVLRFKTGSLTYPWLAHFVANIGMGFLLYSLL